VWLANAFPANGVSVAEKIRAEIARRPIPGVPWEVTASIGVTTIHARGGESIDGMLARADAALYRAKRAGRNQVATDSVATRPSLAVAA
jgi:diguanylate cyclase (GGDEF)-like protein